MNLEEPKSGGKPAFLTLRRRSQRRLTVGLYNNNMDLDRKPTKSHQLFRIISWSRFSACLSILLVFAGCAKTNQPAETPAANVRSSGDVVKVSVAPLTISAGGSGEAMIKLSISPGYHVNANPATYDYLIATQVTAGNVDGITAGKPAYPAGRKQKFQFADEPLAVYEGETQIKLPLSSSADAARVNGRYPKPPRSGVRSGEVLPARHDTRRSGG